MQRSTDGCVIMITILFPIGCRSDEGLSAPVIRRLKKESWCEVRTIQLNPQDFMGSYHTVDDILKAEPFDLVFITGDRVEMCGGAAAAFHNKVKIAHLYAGVVTEPITLFDDTNRHVITLWSDIQLCENEEAQGQVEALLYPLKFSNCHIVGITHLDDLEIDESRIPSRFDDLPYDLILYNTPSISEYERDLPTIKELIRKTYSVLVDGNPDGEAETELLNSVDEFYIGLSRPHFLGLLKNCNRFITNSSCAIYEAPYFLKPEQIIMVGDRNRTRPPVECKPGGSDNIVTFLKNIYCYGGVIWNR